LLLLLLLLVLLVLLLQLLLLLLLQLLLLLLLLLLQLQLLLLVKLLLLLLLVHRRLLLDPVRFRFCVCVCVLDLVCVGFFCKSQGFVGGGKGRETVSSIIRRRGGTQEGKNEWRFEAAKNTLFLNEGHSFLLAAPRVKLSHKIV